MRFYKAVQNCRGSAEQAFEILGIGINGHLKLFLVTLFGKNESYSLKLEAYQINQCDRCKQVLVFNSVLPAFDIGTDLNVFWSVPRITTTT